MRGLPRVPRAASTAWTAARLRRSPPLRSRQSRWLRPRRPRPRARSSRRRPSSTWTSRRCCRRTAGARAPARPRRRRRRGSKLHHPRSWTLPGAPTAAPRCWTRPRPSPRRRRSVVWLAPLARPACRRRPARAASAPPSSTGTTSPRGSTRCRSSASAASRSGSTISCTAWRAWRTSSRAMRSAHARQVCARCSARVAACCARLTFPTATSTRFTAAQQEWPRASR